MMRARFAAVLAVAVCAAGAAQAQALYRWTDAQGGVHITDTPPPASAKHVKVIAPPSADGPTAQEPYELTVALREFPVTLYTAPQCGDPCEQARNALNRRGVPFSEVLVADADTREELKRVADGAEEVPVLFVGRSTQKGFHQESYDALLDAARYPKTGVLKPRSQTEPKPRPVADITTWDEPEPQRGPYTPRFSK